MYYSAIVLLALFVLVIENIDIILGKDEDRFTPALKVYRGFLHAVLVYYLTDALWGVFAAIKHPQLLFLNTAVYYVTMALSVLFWTQYVITYLEETNKFGRFFIYAGRVLAGGIILFNIINLFTPILFSVDMYSVYHPLPARYVFLAVQITLLFVLSLYAFISYLQRKDIKKKRSRYLSIVCFGAIMVIFLSAQILLPYLPMYTIAYMLGIAILRKFVISNEKAELTNELKEAEKVNALKRSISALLDNMPALSFSKDANTGVYLACNQAFAEYAHKADPEGVVGLTDAEIFDDETAKHFVEDDHMAISMDSPYIFFEDVPDAAGNQRQFQTTKFKFTDSEGRLCLLGMCQDVTDMVSIQREQAMTKDAYEKARSNSIVYTHIAQALARGYSDIYYVSLDDDSFIVYHINEMTGKMQEVSRGSNFFEALKNDTAIYVYSEDLAMCESNLDRSKLLDVIDKNGLYEMTYRIASDRGPVYARMRASRMIDSNSIVIGISNVDEEMKKRRANDRIQEEQIVYKRVNALAGDFLCMYFVVPETGRYREISTSERIDQFEIDKEGEDFFEKTRNFLMETVLPEDRTRVLDSFNKEHVLSEVEKNGLYAINYRLKMSEGYRYVQLKAAMVEEKEGMRLIVGLNDIDALVRQEADFAKRLSQAQNRANTDALTGVKTKLAFKDEEERINAMIKDGAELPFAIVMLDVNDLKYVNDTYGHQAGDKYIRDACKIICNTFKHSPVYRVGGDEFAVLVRGSDYKRLNSLISDFNARNEEAIKNDDIVIACGMSEFDKDSCVGDVYKRADMNMYENKSFLKNMKAQ